MRSLILRLAGCSEEFPGTPAPCGRSLRRLEDLRKPAESGPSENRPDSGVREPPSAQAVQSRERTPVARPATLPFAERGGRRASDREWLCSGERSRRKIGPRGNKAVALQKAFLHCKEPPLGTNPSARARPDFSHSRISRALAQITPARQAPFPADSTPWLRTPDISLPRSPFLVSGNANSLRARIPWLPC